MRPSGAQEHHISRLRPVVGAESCLMLSRVGGVSDRDGERKALYWRLPAPRGAGEVHGDFQSAEGQFPLSLRVEHKCVVIDGEV